MLSQMYAYINYKASYVHFTFLICGVARTVASVLQLLAKLHHIGGGHKTLSANNQMQTDLSRSNGSANAFSV